MRNSLQPRSSPMCSLSSSAWRRIIVAHLAQRRQGAGPASPANASARSRNSHGRPRQPAPDDDAGRAGLLDHPDRVGGLPDVAVAEHRDVDVVDQRGDRVPVGRPE